MAVAQVNGVSLAYSDAGEGQPTFLFVHGEAADRRAWEPQAADLSARYRCLAVDLRGSGETPAVGACTIQQAVDDLAALLEVTGAAPAIVAGHGLGGLIALLLGDRYPGLVNGIVLADAPVRRDGLDLRSLSASITDAASTTALPDLAADAGTPADIRTTLTAMARSSAPEAVAQFVGSAVFDDDELRNLIKTADQKPFMAIWPVPEGASFPGEPADNGGDPMWLRDTTMFVRQEPVTDAGHYVQLEQPAVTNALLRAFVDDVLRDPRIDALRKGLG